MHPSARPVYYAVVLAWYVFFFYTSGYVLGNVHKSPRPPGSFNPFWGSQWKYLSFLNVVLQVIFYAVSLLTSAVMLMKKERIATTLISLKGLIFSSLVFPLSSFVFVTFWSIYFYDRELIYPKYLDPIIPEWINHGMHTLILPLTLVEILVTHHQYPSVCKSLIIFGMVALAYQLWILYLFAKTGKWLYPLFKFLSPLGIIVFLGIVVVSVFFYYILGRFLNCLIWGNEVPALDVDKKKHK
ncbi:androgen-dependent TFPI-regulating protein [Erythrolamprus reginae]|uniref:androgen-dependent TFPI-regulating protein n=1 Tax=Erythrolamprus reginae TaxID=121349 RepID=UPI00396CC052